MPKSKAIKKKKKITSSSKRNISFNIEGIHIAQKGKNIIIKNNRTQEEHDLFLDNVLKKRPKLLKNINVTIEKIIQIFINYDKIKLLGGLSYNQILKQNDPRDDGLSELTFELGLSFATSLEGNSSLEPSKAIIDNLIKLLISVRHEYNNYITAEAVENKYSELEYSIRRNVIGNELYRRGVGYVRHIYIIYKELFSGHDDFLMANYGFRSSEILQSFIQLEDSVRCRILLPNFNGNFPAYERFLEWSKNKFGFEVSNFDAHLIKEFCEENRDLLFENGKIKMLNFNEISDYDELFKIKTRYNYQDLVIAEIFQIFGDNNEFLNPKFKGHPLNKTLILTNPIVKNNSNYYLFSFSLPTRNLFDITENLILKSNPQYYNSKYLGNKYSFSRDNYLEKKTAELFKILIPEANVYQNFKYTLKNENEKIDKGEFAEIDLILTTENANYLIEMKAGGLSAPAKRGGLKSLDSFLKDIVGYGAFQSFRALDYIKNNKVPVFFNDNNETMIIDKSKKIFRITIILEHLYELITNLNDLKEIGIIEKEIDFAWTCSIFDLIIFSELLENEKDLIDYLEKRLLLYHRPEMYFQDEIDLLGHFFYNNLVFDEKLIKDKSQFRLLNHSQDIDHYFEKNGPKPKRKKF